MSEIPYTQLDPGMSLRLSRRALSFLSGTQAWADAESGRFAKGEYADDSDVQFMARVIRARGRADGSVSVMVSRSDLDYLDSAIGAWAAGAADSAGPRDEDGLDALADLNAARALLRQMRRLTA